MLYSNTRPSLRDCAGMVHRLVVHGYSRTGAVDIVASAYAVSARKLRALVDMGEPGDRSLNMWLDLANKYRQAGDNGMADLVLAHIGK